MKKATRVITLLCAALLAASCLSGCEKKETVKSPLDPKNPTSITVWNYYNGAQLATFNEMVGSFNETRGKELGIVVSSVSQGSVNDLHTNVMNAVAGKVGAEEVPNIFAAYADTAFEIDQQGVLVDLAGYLTEEQRALYIDGYITEGDFGNSGSIKIFPIAKSTELFLLNETDWQTFADATGATTQDFSTMEGLVDTAQRYYEWTDSLTEAPNDGKAFYGRDAMANYFLIGGMQLGCEIFSMENGKAVINFDHDVIRKIWDNYYVPFVKGYFASSGRFRSDDIKTGNILSFTGSSSGATFFPSKVTTEEAEYEITMRAFPAPQFEGSKGYAVQQGAGMVVTKQSEAEIAASVEFLLWFTQDQQNIRFSIGSGYLPVTKTANTKQAITQNAGDMDPAVSKILDAALETVQSNTLYTTKAFKNGVTARNILESCLSDQATADRAAVKEALEKGKTLEEATAAFVSDEHFESWYQRVLKQLNELEV